MSISLNDINSLKNKKIYQTSNEKIVLTKDYEKIIHSPEYTILGFLNDYMYSSTGTYLVKSTLDGEMIAEIKIELEHATFTQGNTFFYARIDNILYKIKRKLKCQC